MSARALDSLLGRLLRRRSGVRERDDARRYVLTGDRHWGDSIMYWPRSPAVDVSSFSVTGWTTPQPRVGDLLLIPMQSGAWLECLLTEVELERNPADMWSATASSLERYSTEQPQQDRFATQLLRAKPSGDNRPGRLQADDLV